MIQLLQMDPLIIDIFTNIAKSSPVIGLLIVAVVYLIKKLDKKEKYIEELHNSNRENEKENLQVLNNVNNTLDKVIESQKFSSKEVNKTIENLKDNLKSFIEIKLNEIENKFKD